MQHGLRGSRDAGYAGALFNFMYGSKEMSVFFSCRLCVFPLRKQTGSGEREALLLPEREREPGENVDGSSRTKRQPPALTIEARAE